MARYRFLSPTFLVRQNTTLFHLPYAASVYQETWREDRGIHVDHPVETSCHSLAAITTE